MTKQEALNKAWYKLRNALDVNMPPELMSIAMELKAAIDCGVVQKDEQFPDTLKRLSKSEQNKERVNHPSHYTWLKELCGIEVIDIIRHLDFDTGCAVKYLLRHQRKSEEGYTDKDKAIEDLKKAIWYIQDRIKMLEK